MAINRIKPGYLSNATVDGGTAADDAFVGYSLANQRTEFITVSADTTDLDTISSNVDLRAAQIDANVNTISANADTLVTSIDTAESSIDTVSGNVDSFATYANSTFVSSSTESNTFITVELQTDADVSEAKYGNVTANASADVLTLTAGNGMSFTANGDGQSITLAAKLNAILNDRYTADGTANTFTLSRAVTNADEIIVAVDGVIQVPSNNYSVSSTTLTLSNSLPILNGTLVDVRHLPVTGSEGDVRVVPPFNFQGSTYLYAFGAINQPGSSPSPTDVIERIVIASDTNATDVGETHASGLNAGGATHSNDEAYSLLNSGGSSMVARKFPFASATEVAQNVTLGGGGNKSGGSDGTNGYYVKNSIFKFPFAAGTPATTVGTLTLGRSTTATSVSSTHGYISGGRGNFPYSNSDVIEKFPYTSDTNASDVGELSTSDFKTTSGSSSTTHGYVMGGEQEAGGNRTNIDKFPFASDSPSSNPFNGAKMMGFGGSSETHGYFAGGATNNNSGSSGIVKFPYSSDTATSSVGNLTQSKRQGDSGGEQMAND